MIKRLEQDFHKRRYSNGLWTYERVFILIKIKMEIKTTTKYYNYLSTTMVKILKLIIPGFGKNNGNSHTLPIKI